MKIRIDEADRLFSLLIRRRDNWTCQRCDKKYPEGSRGLHCSHFWGRGRENTRFDMENCTSHCFGCHAYFTANPAEHTEWKKKQVGIKRYNALMVRARTYKKKDRKLVVIFLTAELKALERGK